MIQQLRGKVWWEGMNKDIREKLRTCDPCQRYAKSHKQDYVEISHTNMFNIFPGHTLHLDFAEYNNKDYILMVDRLTGYIAAEHTANQGMEMVEQRLKTTGEQHIIQLSPQECSQDHLHLPERYNNGSQNVPPQAPQPTFE